MPDWSDVLKEIKIEASVSPLDKVRRKYLEELYHKTGRNVIAYYSGWLQQSQFPDLTSIDDNDKNAFMAMIHTLDKNKGLDLILHTPGGNAAATESLVDYLQNIFKNDIRVIVPQLAMSAGTMIACASKAIIMGNHSSLGPIDPQYGGIPAFGIIEEFERAKKEIAEDPSTIPVWQTLLSKYPPSFVGECEKAIQWSKKMVTTWLEQNMFKGKDDAHQNAEKIVTELSDHEQTKTHSRHISKEQCEKLGLAVVSLEDMPDKLQDTILTIHHAFMHTFTQTGGTIVKIVENHLGKASILQIRMVSSQQNS
jgi:ClpP class serine protease